jgi:4-hydroxyacetophenone monooxygenase
VTITAHGRPDPAAIRAAIDDADLRVLLMCLFHLTGDDTWLEPPYQPVRDVRLIADPGAGFPSEIQATIRDTAYDLLVRGAPSPRVAHPDDELLHRMISVCLAEDVDPAYVPMIREDMSFSSGDAAWNASDTGRRRDQNVLIVGAGLAGLALAVHLERLGIPHAIVEKNDDVGGTWLENRYPGCRVDTPNHFYSYSFAPNHGWSHYFSVRDEIHRYIRSCAESFGVRGQIRFRTRLATARWDEGRKEWRATLEGPAGTEHLDAAVLVSAIGQVNLPSVPAIQGMEAFRGPMFHSARWPEGLDVGGKHVAVVGTGASSMQIVPTIADEVSSLTIYQRSPQWARPVAEYRDEVKAGTQWLLGNVPFYAVWNRFTLMWRYGDGLLRFLRKDPDWPHPERSLNRVNDRHRQELTDFIRAELADRPELVEQCVPGYPPYGKRMLIDNGWFKTLTKPGVRLVTTAIDRITADSIVTVDGAHHPTDVIVLATGFKVTDLTARLGIVGRNEESLADAWADDNPAAYLGITVPHFPNLFLMYGPNTNLAHGGSIIFQAECQARYITKLLVAMAEQRLDSVEVKQAVHDEYQRRVDDEHGNLVWTHPGMSTWYRNAGGRVISVSPWRLVDYWAMTHDPDLADYHAARRPAPRRAALKLG